jgi:hypothetical protein
MTRFTPQWLQSGTYAGAQDRRLIGALWPAAASSGCAVAPIGGSMSVSVAPGSVAVPTQNNSGSTLCTSDASETVTLTAAPASGLNRIDVIICRPRGGDLDGGANNDFIFDFVTGTALASPTVPATPPGTVALAQIAVAGGSAAIAAGNITDVRPGNLAIPSPAGSQLAAFQVAGATNQPIAAGGAWVLLNPLWAAPSFNRGGGVWAGGVYTVPHDGFYRITGNIGWGLATAFTTPNVTFIGAIWLNGATQLASNAFMAVNISTGTNLNCHVTKTVFLSKGQTVDLRANNGHASINFSILGNSAQSFLEIIEQPAPSLT